MFKLNNVERLITSLVLLLITVALKNFSTPARISLFLVTYLIAGYDVLSTAIKDIKNKQPFGECLLMTLATLGAFVAGFYNLYHRNAFPEEFSEGVAVMIFYQIGEVFQSYAVGKSRKSVAELMAIKPDVAYLIEENKIVEVDPYDVEVGDIIVVSPGEKIPLDGIVIRGTATMDTAAITGESLPKRLEVGDNALSGFINIDGVIHIKVLKEFGESTFSKILDLVENASSNKAKTEKFITKFARYYTPIVVFFAVGIAILPSIFTGDWLKWCMRALNFLIVSCPCALVVSVPLSFFGGIGGASKRGILIKGSNYFESLAKSEVVVFDKTGTLTEGKFSVQDIVSEKFSKMQLLRFAVIAESYSNHPISFSLKEAWEENVKQGEVFENIENVEVLNVRELAGKGIVANIEGKEVAVGNIKLMKEYGLNVNEPKGTFAIVYISIDREFAGYITIFDKIKADSKSAITKLKQLNIKTVMLTGDRNDIGEEVSRELGIYEVHTELLPNEKVKEVEKLLNEKNKNSSLVFVGDGINDAPVLTVADVGIAMGGIGSDAAIEAADVVIMKDEPSKVELAIKIAKKTVSIAKQNIAGAIFIKIVILILSALGIANMWMAIFGDVGVTVIAILNSFRALYTEKMN